MKRSVLCLLVLVMICGACRALGEIGFAEVKKDNVNLRETPNGERICYLDAGYDVYVFEEKSVDGQLWCHVYTDVNQRTRDAWLRGDMLRFISDEFHDVVSVQAGDDYVTGLRTDGTVAIMGNDMLHLPCIETVRSWREIAQVTSSICGAYALDRDGWILTVGRNPTYGTQTAAKLCGNEPILLDADGKIMYATWKWNEDNVNAPSYHLTDEVEGVSCIEALGYERELYGVLTTDGRIICVNQFEHLKHHFQNAPYAAADANWSHIVALRADGTVDAAAQYMEQEDEKCDVSGWKNVVKVAAGSDHTLGLKADGTVYYAGNDGDHAWQVVHWTDVVDIDAGNGYSIALRSDGSVVMAGVYENYKR